jgi:hypothetical protein
MSEENTNEEKDMFKDLDTKPRAKLIPPIPQNGIEGLEEIDFPDLKSEELESFNEELELVSEKLKVHEPEDEFDLIEQVLKIADKGIEAYQEHMEIQKELEEKRIDAESIRSKHNLSFNLKKLEVDTKIRMESIRTEEEEKKRDFYFVVGFSASLMILMTSLLISEFISSESFTMAAGALGTFALGGKIKKALGKKESK